MPECRFREQSPDAVSHGLYSCTLLRQISRVQDSSLCRVGHDACQACSRHDRPTATTINPVIASFLYHIGCLAVEAGGLPDCTTEEAIRLKAWAFDNLSWTKGSHQPHSLRFRYASPQEYSLRRRTYACDVVLCCEDSSPETELALRSCLNQTSATTQVHLVDNGGGAGELIERYAGYGTVAVHHNRVPLSPLATAHQLLDYMSGEFIAIQDPHTVSRPYRVSYSVGLLEEHGGDLLAAGLATASGTVLPKTSQGPLPPLFPPGNTRPPPRLPDRHGRRGSSPR